MFKYYKKYLKIEKSFVGIISKVDSENELFEGLAKALDFPNYFGKNWNAVNDCLCDFSWIEDKNIALVHTSIADLEDELLIIYIDILIEAINSWKDDSEHNLTIYFDTSDKNRIERIRKAI